LSGRLKRRALVVLFTDFVDTVAVDLLLESLDLLTWRHLVIFAALRDPLLERLSQALPADFQAAAAAVIADSFLRDRVLVLEQSAQLGVQVLDVAAAVFTSALLNRYLFIKQRGLL